MTKEEYVKLFDELVKSEAQAYPLLNYIDDAEFEVALVEYSKKAILECVKFILPSQEAKDKALFALTFIALKYYDGALWRHVCRLFDNVGSDNLLVENRLRENVLNPLAEKFKCERKQYQIPVMNVLQFGKREIMMAKPNMPENAFTVSMIPWTSFDGFNLNVKSFDYLIPIFTIGKYKEENKQYTIPFSVQVHHAVCDGYHASCFINDLQETISSVPLIEKK